MCCEWNEYVRGVGVRGLQVTGCKLQVPNVVEI